MPEGREGPVSVLMVAICGYGVHYLKAVLEDLGPSRCRLAGVVDPLARRSPLWPEVRRLGVPACSTIEEFYAGGHAAELAVVSSPIHWHVAQSIAALRHGSAVLCDKPLGATIQDARGLVNARDRSGRWVMIGYQWSFSAAILALKRDILAGLFGRPLRASALCCWPRDMAYYRRNDWAGRLRDEVTGRWILDGPACNAMAHYLHNLFYLLGPERHLSAWPRWIEAELYRAAPIHSCDTAICRAGVADDVEVRFYASHATEQTIDPCFRLEFEEAVVTCGEQEPGIVAVDRAGRRKEYGSPDATPQFRKLEAAVEFVRGRGEIVCGPEAAMPQTLAVDGMHDSVPEIPALPVSLLRLETSLERVWTPGLDDLLRRCYRDGTLPAETGVSWAVAGRRVELEDYRSFPSSP